MKNVKIFMCLVASVLFIGFTSSCSDDDDDTQDNRKWLLSSYEEEGIPVTFSYDNQNRLVEKNEMAADGQSKFFYAFEYDASGKLVKKISISGKGSEYENESIILYTYSNDTVYKKMVGEDEISEKLVMNSKGQLIKRVHSSSSYTTYEYDQAGNLVQTKYFSGSTAESYETTTYAYDTRKSFFVNANIPSWILITEAYLEEFSGVNNIVSRNIVSGNQTSSSNHATAINYQYNEFEQPSQSNWSVTSSSGNSEGIQYFKYIEAK